MSLYGLFKKAGPSGFGYNSTAEQVTEGLDLSGQTWLLIGPIRSAVARREALSCLSSMVGICVAS
jgi:hypothetical protein